MIFQLAMVSSISHYWSTFSLCNFSFISNSTNYISRYVVTRDPLKFDVKYQASAQPFLITGMLVTALAIGHSFLVA